MKEPTAIEILTFLLDNPDIFNTFGRNKMTEEEVIELWKKQQNS